MMNILQLRLKTLLITLLLSSKASMAKSFVTSGAIESLVNLKSAERTISTNPLSPMIYHSNNSMKKTSTTCLKALSLRAGGFVSLPTLTSLNYFFKKYPYVAAFCICGLQASAADLIAQKSASKKSSKDDDSIAMRGGTTKMACRPSFELKRNLAFLFYGGAYQGCFQEFLFNKIFPMIFGEGKAPLTVGLKVTFDMLVVSPFLCLPVAYLIKGAIYRSNFGESIRRYVHDVTQNALLKTYWSVWYPVQIVNFLFVPKQFRISFVACFSFFWLIMLSTISSKSENAVST